MLNGKKVFLKNISPDSLTQLMNWRNVPELRKYFREYRDINEDMQKKWYQERVLGNPNQADFEIHCIKSGKLIGHCGLYYINWAYRHAEFGIYIGDKEYRQGGYGSDALRTLIEHGFDDLNLNKIWCEVYSNNDSINVYKHLGFEEEAVLRQHYYSEGKYWDSTLMGLLHNDYQQRS